jgi:hypothetical protein
MSDDSNSQPVPVPDTVEMVVASTSESVTKTSDKIVQAIDNSNVASVNSTAAAISSAVKDDVHTIAVEVNTAIATAKDLYKSPLSTILTICGRSLLKDTPVTQNNIILIAHNVMESIESLKTLHVMHDITGDQKKQLAIDCLHWMVNNHDELSANEKLVINVLITTVVPNTIDTLIAISNGESELVATVGHKCCIIS